MTVMYIHGYGSDGNATKGRMLRKMLPQCSVVSPTFDYDHCTPWQIQEQIREAVVQNDVSMIVGSSFGGYHTLCATAFFHGVVWAINPVHDVEATVRRVVFTNEHEQAQGENFVAIYSRFDKEVFQVQSRLNCFGNWPADTPLNFALSTNDELLGDHRPLLKLFPFHQRVVWKDNCGHRFLRFAELDLLDIGNCQSR